jgi:hypothetical protein
MLVATSAVLAVPSLINYQGKLTDSGGNPLNGTFTMTFLLYQVSTGGSHIWSEPQTVMVTDGIYSVQLGTTNPLDVSYFSNDSLYLEVVVGDETLSPRQRLTSTAFAMKAALAEAVADGAVTEVMIADGAVEMEKIANSAITGAKIAPDQLTSVHITTNAVGGEELADDAVASAEIVDGAIAAIDLAEGYVNETGDTMTGLLTLPADGLVVGTDQLVLAAGNVGIGTETPVRPLSFSDAIGDKISLWGQTPDGNCLGLGIQPRQLQVYTDGSHADIVFGHGKSSSLTETMRIEGTGNVGIGTKSPDENLHIRNGYAAGRGFLKIEAAHPSDWGEAGLRIKTPQNTWHMRMDDDSNNNIPDGSLGLRSQDLNREVMVWSGNGNVGIGTTSINEKLTVAGTIESITGGIKFPDGTVQTTASAPTWHQILPANDGEADGCNSSRFKCVMNDEAVLDKETGLVWERSPDMTERDWFAAITHCYRRELANRKGLRLPTIEELASLVDEDEGPPTLPAGHPFINVRSQPYWSSTTSTHTTPAGAWGVGFGFGDVGTNGKTGTGYVWCVRGGQGHDAY